MNENNIDITTMIRYMDIPFKETRLKSGRIVMAVTKDKVDKMKMHTYNCAYISEKGKCSKCGCELLMYTQEGKQIDEDDVKFCWECGSEIV